MTIVIFHFFQILGTGIDTCLRDNNGNRTYTLSCSICWSKISRNALDKIIQTLNSILSNAALMRRWYQAILYKPSKQMFYGLKDCCAKSVVNYGQLFFMQYYLYLVIMWLTLMRITRYHQVNNCIQITKILSKDERNLLSRDMRPPF